MKRLISLVLAVAMVLCFAACSQPNTVPTETIASLKYVGDSSYKEKFDEYISIETVLDEISGIDLSMKMGSISGYEKTTDINPDNGSSIDYYLRNGERIYAVYNGYSESMWDYYTTSKSGYALKITFWEEGTDKKTVRNVKIVGTKTENQLTSTNDPYFEATFNSVNKKATNGADDIEIKVSLGYSSTPEEYLLPESITYSLHDNIYYPKEVVYCDDSMSLHRYQCTLDEETHKIDYNYDEVLLYGSKPEIDTKSSLVNRIFGSTQVIMGKNNQIYYDKEGDTWYLGAETTLLFDSEESAETFLETLKASVKGKNFTISDKKAAGYWSIDVGTVIYSIWPDYEDAKQILSDFAINEGEGCSYYTLNITSYGWVISMDKSRVLKYS